MHKLATKPWSPSSLSTHSTNTLIKHHQATNLLPHVCMQPSIHPAQARAHIHIRTQHASTHTPDVQKQASPARLIALQPSVCVQSKAQHTAKSARHRVQAPHARPPPCSARRAGPRLDRTLRPCRLTTRPPLTSPARRVISTAAHAAPHHRRRRRRAVTLAAQHHRVATPQTTITPPLPATSRRTAPPFTPRRLACLSHHLRAPPRPQAAARNTPPLPSSRSTA
jgi:hypothetical protein